MVYNKRTHIEQEVKLKERGVHQTLAEVCKKELNEI